MRKEKGHLVRNCPHPPLTLASYASNVGMLLETALKLAPKAKAQEQERMQNLGATVAF